MGGGFLYFNSYAAILLSTSIACIIVRPLCVE